MVGVAIARAAGGQVVHVHSAVADLGTWTSGGGVETRRDLRAGWGGRRAWRSLNQWEQTVRLGWVGPGRTFRT